jgi:hypothetical protein
MVRTRIAAVTALAALAFLVPAAEAQVLQPRDIAARARPAVVLITAMDGSRTLGTGSGFLVSADGMVVTNRHVIEDARNLEIRLATGEVYDRVLLVSEDERRDLAILRIPGSGLPHLSLGDDRTLAVGDPIYVLGNPRGLDGTFSDGLVSARRVMDGVSMLQITAPISPGSSGGPVMDRSGKVVAVATASFVDGQNLNLAVPARDAAGLIALGEAPRPFERLAAGGRSRAPTTAEREDRPLWERVLLEQSGRVLALAAELELHQTHDPVVEGLNEREEHTFSLRYDRRGTDATLIGVCDSDCSDLDLTVRDPNGRIVGSDLTVTDVPVVEFQVAAPGVYRVTVRMYACEVEPCFFVVHAFETR